jgi:hypothetical protein
MQGLSQITRAGAWAAVGAPGNRHADGYHCRVTRFRRQAPLIPADAGISRRARRSDERVTATHFAIGQAGSPMTIDIWFGQLGPDSRPAAGS